MLCTRAQGGHFHALPSGAADPWANIRYTNPTDDDDGTTDAGSAAFQNHLNIGTGTIDGLPTKSPICEILPRS